MPRGLFEIGTPATVHLFATTVGDQRRYGGILIDHTGVLMDITQARRPARIVNASGDAGICWRTPVPLRTTEISC